MTTVDSSPRTSITRPAPLQPQDVKPRVTTVEGLRQTLTLAWRTLIQIRHNPWELGDFSIQPIIFVLLFTYVFGGAIADSPTEYLQYALPGIIVMNMFFVTMYVGQGLNTDITKGVFDRLRSLPIARWAPLSGRILADMVKQAWSIVLLLVVGFILGFRLGTSVAGLAAAFLLIMFFALCFSWVTVLVGVLAPDPEKVQLFGFTVLFPVTFLERGLRPDRHDARLVAAGRQGQSGHHPQRCGPRSHGGRTSRSAGVPLPDLGHRDRSRLRPTLGARPTSPRLTHAWSTSAEYRASSPELAPDMSATSFDPRALLAEATLGVLATIKSDGRPQLSPVMLFYDQQAAVIYVSMGAGSAKTANLRRDARATLEVTRPDGRAWATAEGTATLTGPATDPDGPEVQALVDYYRVAAGEHPDWQEYRSVMVSDRRVLMTMAVDNVYGAEIG